MKLLHPRFMIKSGDVLPDIILLESEIEINFVENIVKTEAWFILKVKETRKNLLPAKTKHLNLQYITR